MLTNGKQGLWFIITFLRNRMYKYTGASESHFHPLTSMSFLLYKSSIISKRVLDICHEGHHSRIGVVSLLDPFYEVAAVPPGRM
jgi:hypothetical protein